MPSLEIAAAIRDYYAQANALPLTATDLFRWLGSLPPAQRTRVTQGDFAGQQPEFLWHCLETRGLELRDFMATQVPLVDFAEWVAGGGQHTPPPRSDQ